ncbi:YHYH protein [Olleya sp. 1-3]|uniref:YHYH protein n=1 Tax=Olleya sp. 1-3 TaxID=2058323 RepID=UPI000C3340DC|nr:YHYH protein [Olleya sp. 1-3]PKG51360.1 hypothetical protein CXF54_08100 [Olleya sp. 1-3]
MKHIFKILAVVIIGLLYGCNSQKKTTSHSHDGSENHSHDTESVVKSTTNYYGNYDLEDGAFGTKTKVTIVGDTRVMVTNSLPNHETGTFPNPGNPNTIASQNITYKFPVTPKYTGKAQWMREPGVALNGIKFEPQTAEVVVCDTGENYRVEAIQDVIDLGLDFNHAHVQPTGAYHYHGTPTSMISKFDSGQDLVHIGFAHDGFPMYYSKSGQYKPSFKLLDGTREGEDCTYDNPKQHMDIAVGGHHDGTYGSDYEYVAGYGDLDECNGITVDGKYMYLVTNQFPYVGRCVMGEVETEQQGPPNGQPNGQGERPNPSQIIEQMDANNDGKLSVNEAKGPLKEDFSKIDSNSDGFITKEEIEKASKSRVQRPQGGRPQGGRN